MSRCLRALLLMIFLVPGRVTAQSPVEVEAPSRERASPADTIATGQGLEAERRQVGGTVNTVLGDEVARSREANVVSALAGKAPNVEVTSSAGDPGAGAYVRIRGTRSAVGATQPLVVVDGIPFINASREHDSLDPDNPIAGTPYPNRATDLNPADIARIEILKGPAATSVYGSRGANGVILIETRSGRRNTMRWTLDASMGLDRVTALPGLQTRFGQGADLAAVGGIGIIPGGVFSYGARLDGTVPVFDHARELFGTGTRTDNTVTLEGGTDRTAYYVSLGYARQGGTLDGRSAYRRTAARLRVGHELRSDLRLSASFAHARSSGDLVQQGSNVSGLLVGSLRTPPEFDNCLRDVDPCYADPSTGLHRTYNNPEPASDIDFRTFDNPYWVANAIGNTTDVARTSIGIAVDYDPASWLRLRYLAGGDFATDRRHTVAPRSSSVFLLGRINRQELVDDILDQSVMLTATRDVAESVGLEVTLGHNLNRTGFQQQIATGFDIPTGATDPAVAAQRFSSEFETTVDTDGYFARATLDVGGELFLGGGVRGDAGDAFGRDLKPDGSREKNRFWYPSASAVWDLGARTPGLDFGRLRVAYGVAGVQPPPFSNVTDFESVGIGSQRGFEPVGLRSVRGNPDIDPERTRELEIGADVSLAGDRVRLGVTRYWQKTTDGIVRVPQALSSGFIETLRNGAVWRNWGWEAQVDWVAVRRPSVTWWSGIQWGRNRSRVDELPGAGRVFLNGFDGTNASVVEGHALPVIVGSDFVRFGRGTTVGGASIDTSFSGWEPGDLYIDPDGFPVWDPEPRVLGDPNPDWTGSVRNTVTIFDRLTISALVDVKWGGEMWNGTKNALVYYGTHEESQRFHGAGVDTVFAGVGPGAGTPVSLNSDTWTVFGPLTFGGVNRPYIEDAGFIKLRDVSVTTSWEGGWLEAWGLESAQLTLSGRNLVTWTDYTGLDPESNWTGQTSGRGLEYFNNPQTRSFLIAVSLRR